MNEVMEHAEGESQAELGKKLDLKEHGERQGLLPAHKEDALQSAPRDVKQTDR
jgi:hypothetical protein